MRAAAQPGAHPSRDHRPRPDRRRAAGARRRPDGLTVIVGEEIRTADGDLIALFLERAGARPGCRRARRSPRSASRAASWGSPTRSTGSAARCSTDPRLEAIAPLVDWVEAHNARIVGGAGNERAAAFARRWAAGRGRVRRPQRRSRWASRTRSLDGDPSTPAGSWRRWPRWSWSRAGRRTIVRLLTPVAKVVQWRPRPWPARGRTPRRATTGDQGQDHRPVADAGAAEPVASRCHGDRRGARSPDTRRRRTADASRARISNADAAERVSLSSRLRQTEDDRLDPRPAADHRLLRRAQPGPCPRCRA